MINESKAKLYCNEDISNIENYQQAVNDKKTTWHCHHRGEILPCGRYTVNDLKKFNLYYSRPANELIFLTHGDHRSLHHKGQSHYKGKHHSEETKKKISAALKGRQHSEEARRKMSEAKKSKPFSEEARKKMSEAHKGKHHSEQARKKLSIAIEGRMWWNNGVKTARAFECPGPEWKKGRLKLCKR